MGEDWGTPVSPTYEPPFKFTGILKSVTVEAKGLDPSDLGDFDPGDQPASFR